MTILQDLVQRKTFMRKALYTLSFQNGSYFYIFFWNERVFFYRNMNVVTT